MFDRRLRAQPGGRITASAAELGRRWGWERHRVSRRLETWRKAGLVRRRGRAVTVIGQGAMPLPATVPEAVPRRVTKRQQVPPAPAKFRPSVLSGVVFLVGLAMGGVGLWLNATFRWAFGRTSDAGIVLAVIGLGTDAATLVLPSVMTGLWRRRRLVLVALAGAVYVLAVAMTLTNGLGFASTQIGDAVAGRAAIVTTASALTHQRTDRITTARLAAEAAGRAREAECAIRGPRCRDREMDERAALAALASAIAAPIPPVPTIGAADPQIDGTVKAVAWASRGILTPDPGDVEMLRLIGVALMPILGGLLIAFAMGLSSGAAFHAHMMRA